MYLRQAHAAISNNLINPLNSVTTLADVFAIITNIIVGIGISLTIIYLALGGIQYMSAKGDPKAADAARGALTNALIGFIIVLLAVALRTIVLNLTDANIDNFNTIVPN